MLESGSGYGSGSGRIQHVWIRYGSGSGRIQQFWIRCTPTQVCVRSLEKGWVCTWTASNKLRRLIQFGHPVWWGLIRWISGYDLTFGSCKALGSPTCRPSNPINAWHFINQLTINTSPWRTTRLSLIVNVAAWTITADKTSQVYNLRR